MAKIYTLENSGLAGFNHPFIKARLKRAYDFMEAAALSESIAQPKRVNYKSKKAVVKFENKDAIYGVVFKGKIRDTLRRIQSAQTASFNALVQTLNGEEIGIASIANKAERAIVAKLFAKHRLLEVAGENAVAFVPR